MAWTTYKALDVPDTFDPAGNAGEKLTDDLKELADRAPYKSGSAPGAGDDVNDGFAAGSTWLDTSTGYMWVCISNTSTAAVWRTLYLRSAGALILCPGDGSSVSGQRGLQLDSGGDARGTGAVDLQTTRSESQSVSSGAHAVISGGRDNEASGPYAVSSGGRNNFASGEYSLVTGGKSNSASGEYASVAGGRNNNAASAVSCIGGGSYNSASGDELATIGGGLENRALGECSGVAGGFWNLADEHGSCVTGGGLNYSLSYCTSIGGGFHNKASGSYATVAGGFTNEATSSFCPSIGGGWENVASGSYACVGGGAFNEASGIGSVVAGGGSYSQGNTASGNRSAVGGGSMNTASGDYATVSGGTQAVASLFGQTAQAAGCFLNSGDAQFTRSIMRRATTNATTTELTLDGDTPASGNRFTIDDEHAYSCFVRISARRDTGSDQAFFVRQLVIERTSGTVALEGSVQTVGTDINPAGWTISLTADNTNKSLKIEVTGAASTNIRWVAVVEAIEIQYAN